MSRRTADARGTALFGRAWRAGCVAAALGGTAACGGGGSSSTNPTPVPTPTPAPVRSVVTDGSFSLSAPDDEFSYFARRAVVTSIAGRLEATIDWTYPTNTVWMYIAEGACTAEQFSNVDCPGATCECQFSVISQESGPKPRVLSVPNASPGTRTLIVWNRGPQDEGVSFQVTLTTGGTSSTGVTASRAGATGVEVGRKRSVPPSTR